MAPTTKRRKMDTQFLGSIRDGFGEGVPDGNGNPSGDVSLLKPCSSKESFQLHTSTTVIASRTTNLTQKLKTPNDEKSNGQKDKEVAGQENSSTNVDTGPEESLPPELPEIGPTTRIKVRQLPAELLFTRTSGQHVVEPPPPLAQKEITVEIMKRGDCKITSVQALNHNGAVGNFVKCARICGLGGGEICWKAFVKSPLLQLKANSHYTVGTCSNNDLVMLTTRTGQMERVCRMATKVAILLLHDHICMTVLSDGDVHTWNLSNRSTIVHKSAECLLRSPDSKIMHCAVSDIGIPMFLLNKDECVVFSRQLDSWINVYMGTQVTPNFFRSMEFMAAIVPQGLIALICRHKLTDKQRWELDSVQSAIREESQLEMLLTACQALESAVEFRFVLNLYAQRLMSQGKRQKMAETLADLSANGCPGVDPKTLLEDVEAVLSEYGVNYASIMEENGEQQIDLSFID